MVGEPKLGVEPLTEPKEESKSAMSSDVMLATRAQEPSDDELTPLERLAEVRVEAVRKTHPLRRLLGVGAQCYDCTVLIRSCDEDGRRGDALGKAMGTFPLDSALRIRFVASTPSQTGMSALSSVMHSGTTTVRHTMVEERDGVVARLV
jgi:hypothetical protein